MSEGILGNATGGFGFPKTYILTDENGNELTGVYVESETIFTATDNDVREGSVYASNNGVSTGTKVIPAYHTYEGYKLVTSGNQFIIKLTSPLDLYDYTKLQAIICIFSNSEPESVQSEKVCISNNIYAVNSTEIISVVNKDSENKTINFGITNDSENIYIIRYFMYKEII